MKRNIYLFLFLAASIVQLASDIFPWNIVHDVSKCLLIPMLAGYYWVEAPVRSPAFLIALFFCWLGDVFLLWQSMFLAGLFAFLLGHVFYVFAYRQHQSEDRSAGLLPTQKVRFALPTVLAGTGLVVVLYPVLNSMRLPVMIYGVVIVIMVMTALFRFGRTTASSFWLVFAGAVLFMVSDSILAINKFLMPVSLASFWIMLTYLGAQLMIVAGISQHRST